MSAPAWKGLPICDREASQYSASDAVSNSSSKDAELSPFSLDSGLSEAIVGVEGAGVEGPNSGVVIPVPGPEKSVSTMERAGADSGMMTSEAVSDLSKPSGLVWIGTKILLII